MIISTDQYLYSLGTSFIQKMSARIQTAWVQKELHKLQSSAQKERNIKKMPDLSAFLDFPAKLMGKEMHSFEEKAWSDMARSDRVDSKL